MRRTSSCMVPEHVVRRSALRDRVISSSSFVTRSRLNGCRRIPASTLMATSSQATGLGQPIFCPAADREFDGHKAMLLSLRGSKELHDFWQGFEFPGAMSSATSQLLRSLMPFLVEAALDAWTLFLPGQPLTALKAGGTVTLTQRQVLSILACAIFDILPKQESFDGQKLTFTGWVGSPVCAQKWACLVAYLSAISSEAAGNPAWTGTKLSFYRCGLADTTLPTPEAWAGLTSTPLSKLSVVHGAPIETQPGALQADFANQYIGGGVLDWGNVQEEIRFTISPECLASLLFCDCMLPHEAILIRGSRIFSRHTGYGGRFAFAGPAADDTPIDADGHRDNLLVAFDAVPYRDPSQQYDAPDVVRELRKVYAAMGGPSAWPCERGGAAAAAAPLRPFATGNWGCGMFNGDPQLKAVLQWLAASAVQRDVLYFPYGDSRLAGLEHIVQLLAAANSNSKPDAPAVSVGVLARWALEYGGWSPSAAPCSAPPPDTGFFKYLEGRVAALAAHTGSGQ